MLTEYRAHLENLDIIKFTTLLQKAGKIALSIKAQVEKPKRNGQQVLAVSTQPDTKRKRQEDKPWEELPPILCMEQEMLAILDKWTVDTYKTCRETTNGGIKET
jgi:hypothetical protein